MISIAAIHPPEHRYGLNAVGGLNPFLSPAATNHNGPATGTPAIAATGIQLIGNELGPAGVAHRPHLRRINTGIRNELLCEATEKIAVLPDILPPGNTIAR